MGYDIDGSVQSLVDLSSPLSGGDKKVGREKGEEKKKKENLFLMS